MSTNSLPQTRIGLMLALFDAELRNQPTDTIRRAIRAAWSPSMPHAIPHLVPFKRVNRPVPVTLKLRGR